MTIALITGGSRGLGRNAAVSLARRGVDIILTYRSNRAEADAAVAEISALGRRAAAIELDVGQSSMFQAFAGAVKTQLAAWGVERFDYLVNNAGNALYGPFAEITEAQFDEAFAVHLKGPFFLTQALLPLIADGGRILNVSTGLTRFSVPGSSAYATMKGGIEVLTRYLAKELGPRGITANVIAPGAIETDFGGGRLRSTPQIQQLVASNTALGRTGKPDDIGPAIAAMLSGDLGWMNAQRVEFSGGMFL
ncbi:MAG TPA: SDR family oxidoreductase [Hyphomonadaceae bacterium]|nr:SDR family oxidoreductase [Hyphomonadaceae bacterium]